MPNADRLMARCRRLPLLAGGDAPLQAAHPQRSRKRRSSTSRTSPAPAPSNMLYDSITNRYTFKLEVDGEDKELTRGELMVYVRQPDPALRARAYQELYRVLRHGRPHPGADVPDPGARLAQRAGRPAPLRQPDLGPQPGQRYPRRGGRYAAGGLPSATRRSSSAIFHLKARWLGMERLRRYDIYAPVAKSDKRYAFAAGSRDGARFLPASSTRSSPSWPSASSTKTTWTAKCARASAAAPSAPR